MIFSFKPPYEFDISSNSLWLSWFEGEREKELVRKEGKVTKVLNTARIGIYFPEGFVRVKV